MTIAFGSFMLRAFGTDLDKDTDPVVITGIGLITALGRGRENVWQAIQQGRTNVRPLQGLTGLADMELIAATVDVETPPGQLKTVALGTIAAEEALANARIDWNRIDRQRFGCMVNSHMGDIHGFLPTREEAELQQHDRIPWWDQFLPNTACVHLARYFDLRGPRLSHAIACATSLLAFFRAVRAIHDNQCDIALVVGADHVDPLFAAGFRRMRVLAEHPDPQQACRPFDQYRNGFVLGEGGAALVVERLSHALQRDVPIYAEVLAGSVLAEAHHVTDLDQDSEALVHLIRETLRKARLAPADIQYLNAHGTGTEQNDRVEMRAIRQVFGRHTHRLSVSSSKSMVGHTVNAAGCIELAVTAMGMRDGFAPPNINLTHPDPECEFDPVRNFAAYNRYQHALKVSVGFGGHLIAVALRRWNDVATGYAYPVQAETAATRARAA